MSATVPVAVAVPREVLNLLLKVALSTEQGQAFLSCWRLGAGLPDGPAELVVGAGTYTVHPPGAASPPPPEDPPDGQPHAPPDPPAGP